MKKIKIIIVIVCIFMSTACGLSDWIYQIHSGYEIRHLNPSKIYIFKEQITDSGYEDLEVVIPKFVAAFTYNDRYICIDATSSPPDGLTFEEFFKITSHEYYIIDATTDEVQGPFTKEEYNQKLIQYNIKDLPNFEKTVPAPKDRIAPLMFPQ